MLPVVPLGARVAGRFLVEALAGAGGMGAVYRAHDEQTGQPVALKVIRSRAGGREEERFARESGLLAELRHPGIVGYHAHGVTDAGEPYLAMDWLDGEDLSKRLCRGRLGPTESVMVVRRSAEALAVAHARGVVHRDLKPSNLFLRDGQVDKVAILDFGIARRAALSQAITRTGTVMGTPGYMAPEQARGEREVSPAADVFSLGCVLFECLTGEHPFVADHAIAVLAKILFGEPPRLRRVRPELPAEFEALLERMLAKERADRLPDARAIVEALDALEGQDLSAGAEGATAARARLVEGEQHLISVLMATPPSDLEEAPVSADAATMEVHQVGLAGALAELGAQVEVLADGSVVATLLHGSGAATDQAAQAARCAMLIRSRWPGASIALCTGRGQLDERLPVGEVLDRAAALLRDRPSGPPSSEQILLDEVTRGLLEVRFRVHQTPSGRYALDGEDLELDASRPLLGKPTPCVGREVELGMLEGALSACAEDREPRALVITAPPGAGKSRLRHEFLRRVEARGDEVLVLLGRGDPMSAGSSYGLLSQALRRLCGIVDGEGLPVRREKLAQRIGERVRASERARVVAFMGELCGVAFPDEDDIKLRAARQDPLIMSDQIARAMLDFLRAECEARPVLVLLEDLHWGDALTVKLCEGALRALKTCPLMVLALARPEVDALFPRLWPGIAQVAPLRPLGKKAGERLAQQVLGKRVGPETVARIVAQSEGNALFLEELIRAAAEGRGDEAPETVLAMLQARIGRLPAGARRALRAASVFGETSWLGGISALLGGSQTGQDLDPWLSRLIQDEILEQRRESRFPDEREYRFRHALMRDASYGLLTEDDRVEAHRIVGEYLEARGEPDARVLAEHFEKGRELDRASLYYLQAAEQSYEANDMEAMLLSVERGLACGAQGEQRGALLSLRVAIHLWREQYAEVIALGVHALDLLPPGSRRWCRAMQFLFPAATMTQQPGLLGELSGCFARVEPSIDARGDYLRAATWLCVMFGVTGAKEPARAFLERAREITALLDRSDVATLGCAKGSEACEHHVILDAPWSCLRANAEGRDLLRAAGEQHYQVILGAHCGKALQDLGDLDGAEASLRESLAHADRLNDAFPLAYVRAYLARLLAATAPIACLDEAARLAHAVIAAKNMTLSGVAHGAIAEIKRRRGDLAGAHAEARAACEAARPFPGYSWDLIALDVRILLELGRTLEALEVGEEAIRRMEQLGLQGAGELALRLALVEARHAAGQVDAARALLADAIPRLKKRLDDIPDAAARARYLTNVPTNARIVALAKEWLELAVSAS